MPLIQQLTLEHHRPILARAERATDAVEALHALRPLGLDDFGVLLWSLPDPLTPNLSRLLPKMAPEDVQVAWTGSSGDPLLAQSLGLVRVLESAAIRHAGISLAGRRILDLGCGYGRFTRLLYYFTNPSDLVCVDASARSLAQCREDGVLGTFVKCDAVPSALPVSDLDVAFSFSMFTHLSRTAALATLAAVRATLSPGQLFVFTIRVVEFWRYIEHVKRWNVADAMEARHRSDGFAFHPSVSATFGDATMSLDFLGHVDGWELAGFERVHGTPYKLVVSLTAR